MGCCMSSNSTSKRHQNFDHQEGSESLKPKSPSHESRAPPPNLEEETVKEVLSETPKLIKPPPPPPILQPIKNPLPEHHNQEPNTNKIHIEPNGRTKDTIFQEKEILSDQEMSEVCSLSLSETVSTTTYKRDNDDDEDEEEDGEEGKQRIVKKPSPASKLASTNRRVSGDLFGPGRDRVIGKSPNRRTEQSPEKRYNAGRGLGDGGGGAVKLVQSREAGTGKGGLKPDQNRRDLGESPGRRSRSPATNRSTMGRCPSARRAMGSPGRVGTDLPQSGGSVLGSKCASSSNTNGTTANESLENPLVSLECFIFL